MGANNTGGRAWTFKLTVAHRQKSDGSLESKIDWDGDYLEIWEPHANITEEVV